MSETVHVARAVELLTPSEEFLQTDTIWFRDDGTARVLLDWHRWEQTADAGWFRLDDAEGPEEFVPGADVALELTYDPTDGSALPSTQPELRTRLADPNDPVRATAAWQAEAVRQPEPEPDETELTETVFSSQEDADPKAHVAGFELSSRSSADEQVDEDQPPVERDEFDDAEG